MAIKRTVSQGQSLMDMCNQNCGSLDFLIQVSVMNNISPTEALNPGQELNFPQVENEVTKYFRINNIIPATAFVPSKPEELATWQLKWTLS